MKSDDKEHYIFYIQYTRTLPVTFFSLGEVLKDFNITLIPILPSEIANMTMSKRQYIVSITADLNSQKGLQVLRRNFLDFALLNQKLCLFDVSSFGKIPISYRLEKNNSYYNYVLPMSFKEIGNNIASHYYSQLGTVKRWPGGSKARLPATA